MNTEERLKAFGKKLKETRKELKVSQREACQEMGIDFRNYSEIERGRGTSTTTLLKIADYYGIDLGALNENNLQGPRPLTQNFIVTDKTPVLAPGSLGGEK